MLLNKDERNKKASSFIFFILKELTASVEQINSNRYIQWGKRRTRVGALCWGGHSCANVVDDA